MALNNEDRNWIGGQFDKLDKKVDIVHKRVTDSEKEQTKQVGDLRIVLREHLVAPCAGVQTHEKRYHINGARKKWMFFAAIVTAVTGTLALLGFAIQAIVKGVSAP